MAFFANILGNLSPPILAKYKKNVSFFSYKRVIKIPLLYEIQPFDNTEKVYESISGHTDRNPVLVRAWLKLFLVFWNQH